MRLQFHLPRWLFGLLLLGSCKKQDNPQQVTPQQESTIDFGPNGGFQYRNHQNIEGPGDATDWIGDGAWNDKEKQLFANLNLSLDVPQQSGTWYSSVYANPTLATEPRIFVLEVSRNHPAPVGSRATYVIVDLHYKELQRGDVAAGQSISTTIAPNTLAAGALYRLYYVCYGPGQQVYYRSHGDIKVE